MIQKKIEHIDASNLDSLIADQIAEGKTIDYKRELPSGSDGDKKEFLADVSSFANTIGGDLLIGIEENAGIPARVVGIQTLDLDAEIRRLDDIINSGIAPRIRYTIRRIAHSSGDVLLIRMETSWTAPHRVIFKGHDKFYGRNSAGKYQLDVTELRDAFLRSSTVTERIRSFREKRITDIAAGRTPLSVPAEGKLVLHLLPLEAFATTQQFDVIQFINSPHRLQPMGANSWNHRINFDGAATYVPKNYSSACYTQLYRNGIIEAVESELLNRKLSSERVIPSMELEGRLVEFTEKYLNVQRELGVNTPIYICITLIGAVGCYMGTNMYPQDLADRYSLEIDPIVLPEIGINDFNDDITKVFKPCFDMIWNSCGYPDSPNYDASGKWKLRK